jgi:hypothetical protein
MQTPPRALFCTVILMSAAAGAFAQDAAKQLDEPAVSRLELADRAKAIEQFWTKERMATAKPMPLVERVVEPTEVGLVAIPKEPDGQRALPGYAPGFNPASRRPFVETKHTITPDHPLFAAAAGDPDPLHGAPGANPLVGPYGPFQRWTEFDPITNYPTSTHGKLFFTLPGIGNFVCSATVINRNTLITAGHCNSDGAGTFATNRLFCPSYLNGVNPARGCWSVVNSKTSAGWHLGGDPDNDYACLITQPTGTIHAAPIGNVTGWLGRAWNFAPSQAERTFGYPAAAPFNGLRLISTASTEWYNIDFTPGGQASKAIGSDLTGGSSGGSWILGWGGAEFADSDGSLATDPGANWVNGVNSHKRCLINCASPPTNFNGVFWQEMSSPPFMNTAAADESEDIVAVCFGAGGS